MSANSPVPGGQRAIAPQNRTASSVAVALLIAMRPRQWVKNVLVFVAPAAAGLLFHAHYFFESVLAFVLFSLLASGTYLFNDASDVDADRKHPTKRTRPIASGALPMRVALIAASVLVGIALVCGFVILNANFGFILVTYVVINLAYSAGLKTVAVVELGAVASGFILRAAGGGSATGVPLSKWFIVVISFGALFVVTGKRLAEFQRLGDDRTITRKVLGEYTESFLKSTLTLCAAVTVSAYVLWTFDHAPIFHAHKVNYTWLELTTVPVVLAVLHVLRVLDAGKGGSPEDLVYEDRTVQILGLCWLVIYGIGIYA